MTGRAPPGGSDVTGRAPPGGSEMAEAAGVGQETSAAVGARGKPAIFREDPPTPATSLRGAGLVFALALAARLAVVAWAAGRIPPVADGSFYHTIATRIAEGLGYTWLWPDGAVTYAGHYPVGYPALVGAAYWIAGPSPPAAMLLHALLGALAAVAAYSLAGRAGGRRAAAIAGGLVALHPGLLAYTPAMMTEGVTAALVAAAAWAAMGGGGRHGDAARELPDEKTPAAPPEIALQRGDVAWLCAALAGAIVGVATLVRPQSLVLAPIFGWLASRGIARVMGSRVEARRIARGTGLVAEARGIARVTARGAGRRLAMAGLATIAALAVCAPWTARNCVRMKTCALVSYNGGWNLLIGADDASTGAWAEIKVPAECREVWDEAAKDACFGAAARRYIAEHPGRWLALAPKKLAATFDYAGAGGWYLHAANPVAFPARAKTAIGVIETVFERLMLILALLATGRGAALEMRSWRAGLPRRAWSSWRAWWRVWSSRRAWSSWRGWFSPRAWSSWRAGMVLATVAAGLVGAVTLHAWIAYVALGVALLGAAPQMSAEAAAGAETAAGAEAAVGPEVAAGAGEGAILPAAAAAVILSLAGTHAVFFGAGRYSLVAFPFVTAVAALAIARLPASVAPKRARNEAAGAGGAE